MITIHILDSVVYNFIPADGFFLILCLTGDISKNFKNRSSGIWLFVVLNGFRFYPAPSGWRDAALPLHPADAWQPRFITTNTPVKNAPKILPVIRAYFIRKSKRFLLHSQAGNAYLQRKLILGFGPTFFQLGWIIFNSSRYAVRHKIKDKPSAGMKL